MEIKPETLSKWIKFIRFHPDLAERYMDCFWESQTISKQFLLNMLEGQGSLGNVYIFGGWYGILAQLLIDSPLHSVRSIYSIDIDPKCEWVINDTIKETFVHPVTCNMSSFNYDKTPNTVINTSTEHVTQSEYDVWWDKIPEGTMYILQGNNFWDDPEHIRTACDLDDFKSINNVQESTLEFAFKNPGPNNNEFFRYMVMGIK